MVSSHGGWDHSQLHTFVIIIMAMLCTRLCFQLQVSGWTPLFFAAKRDSLSLVKLLLARGADPKIRDKVMLRFVYCTVLLRLVLWS